MRVGVIFLVIALLATTLFSQSVFTTNAGVLKTPMAPVFQDNPPEREFPVVYPRPNNLPRRDPVIGDIFVAGDTWYDHQSNGAIAKMIAVDQDGNIHLTWMDGYDEDLGGPNRHQKYNFFNSEAEEWLADDGQEVDNGERGGYGCLWLSNEDVQRAMPFFHTRVPQGGEIEYISMAGLDWIAGVGAFQSYMMPRYPEQTVIWPQGVLSSENVVHVAYNRRDGDMLSYTQGVIGRDDEILFEEVPRQIERAPMNTFRIARSPVSERAAIAWPHSRIGFDDLGPWEGFLAWQMNNDLYVAFTENGEDWNFDNPVNVTRIVPPNPDERGLAAYGDTLRFYQTMDLIFDQNDNLHIVFDARLLMEQSIPESEPPVDAMSTDASMLYHWSEETDRITPVASGWFYQSIVNEDGMVERRIDPGYWHQSNVCYPSLGYDENGDLYCVFNYYPPDDYSVANFCNGDIAVTVSEDNGETWYEPTMVTETTTLEAEIGESACEVFPTIWEVVDDNIHISYVFDTEPGSAIIDYPDRVETATLAEFYYHRMPVEEIEREEIFEGPPFHTDIRQMIHWVQREPGVPLPNEAVAVSAEIEAAEGHEIADAWLEFRIGPNRENLDEPQRIEMQADQDNIYTAQIPALDADTHVWYRVIAQDEEEFEAIWPENYWHSYVLREGGNLGIEDVQYRDPDWGVDYSPYLGFDVTLTGIVTTPPEFNEIYGAIAIQDRNDYWSGIWIRGADSELEVGTEIRVTGTVREQDAEEPLMWKYLTFIEVVDQNDVEILGNQDPIEPLGVDIVELRYETHAEHLEGVLIELENIEIDTLHGLNVDLDSYMPITDAFHEEENESWLTLLGLNDAERNAVEVDSFRQGTEIPWLVGVFTENHRYAVAPRSAEDFSPDLGVKDLEVEYPNEFSLVSVYPNPFNASTAVEFQLAAQGKIDLSLFDLNGKLVQSIASDVFTAGNHKMVVDGAELSNGIYILKLTGNSRTAAGKIVMMK